MVLEFCVCVTIEKILEIRLLAQVYIQLLLAHLIYFSN